MSEDLFAAIPEICPRCGAALDCIQEKPVAGVYTCGSAYDPSIGTTSSTTVCYEGALRQAREVRDEALNGWTRQKASTAKMRESMHAARRELDQERSRREKLDRDLQQAKSQLEHAAEERRQVAEARDQQWARAHQLEADREALQRRTQNEQELSQTLDDVRRAIRCPSGRSIVPYARLLYQEHLAVNAVAEAALDWYRRGHDTTALRTLCRAYDDGSLYDHIDTGEDEDEAETDCPNCEGSGEEPDDESLPCHYCAGNETVPMSVANAFFEDCSPSKVERALEASASRFYEQRQEEHRQDPADSPEEDDPDRSTKALYAVGDALYEAGYDINSTDPVNYNVLVRRLAHRSAQVTAAFDPHVLADRVEQSLRRMGFRHWTSLGQLVLLHLQEVFRQLDREDGTPPHRERTRQGRDRLTESGTFQSDKYPWCPAGFVPLKLTDPEAREALADYVSRKRSACNGDEDFLADLLTAIHIHDDPEESRAE